jgi:hypothetical protein
LRRFHISVEICSRTWRALSRASLRQAIKEQELKGSNASAWVISKGSAAAEGTNLSLPSAVTTRRQEISASLGDCSIKDSSFTAISRLVCSARSR